jgi:moderate conductance mechanosensitive channel
LELFGAEGARQATGFLEKLSNNVFNFRSILVFILFVVIALVLGRLIAHGLRWTVHRIGTQTDRTQDLSTVNRLRRIETYLIMSSATIRVLLVIFAIYLWWIFEHPSGQPTALIGASALAAILVGGVLGPVLRDMAAGSFMMAEQWYGVGDYIRVEPFMDMQGVVERVTLRSTRIRTLNGEVVWVSNQNIQAVRLAPKGIRTLALELFVDNEAGGIKLIEKANRRLPMGPLLLITPLTVVSSEKVGDNLWHITAVGETAPGREWLIQDSAVQLIKWMDEKNKRQIIAHGPLARDADQLAERSFKRTIQNARKKPVPRKSLVNHNAIKNTVKKK